MAGRRKQFSSEFKVRVALEAIKGQKTANAHCLRVWSASRSKLVTYAQFDLRTGKVLDDSALHNLYTYPVRIKDDTIY